MDNKLNEIRRKISGLRAKMLDAEGSIRDQINRDLDCTETSIQLMAMRKEMVSLIGQRDGDFALGTGHMGTLAGVQTGIGVNISSIPGRIASR